LRTLGIDLASADARTGAVVISWADGDGGKIDHIAQPASDSQIAALAVDADAIAIDAPLGWPIGFANAIASHRSGRSWPDTPDAELRLRLTDRRLGDEHIWPLSVSTDRIGIVAFRAARLLPRLGRGPSPARDGSDGIFEVYPAAALVRWAQRAKAYKRRDPGHEVGRRAILDWVALTFGIDPGDHRESLVASSDLLDALICAILAHEGTEGRLEGPPEADRAIAREEGWIYVPPRLQPPSDPSLI
jgi:predicted RNase H-like nuclease